MPVTFPPVPCVTATLSLDVCHTSPGRGGGGDRGLGAQNHPCQEAGILTALCQGLCHGTWIYLPSWRYSYARSLRTREKKTGGAAYRMVSCCWPQRMQFVFETTSTYSSPVISRERGIPDVHMVIFKAIHSVSVSLQNPRSRVFDFFQDLVSSSFKKVLIVLKYIKHETHHLKPL